MRIIFMIFVSSAKEPQEPAKAEVLIKTFESAIRPVKGDIIDDPGFHPEFHNGYEVVKVTLNYEAGECYVSLLPLVPEKETIGVEAYKKRLKDNGWRPVSKDDLIGR